MVISFCKFPVAAAVVQLKGVASVVVSNRSNPDSATSQLSFLQSLLMYIVSVVANYIDAEELSKSGIPSTGLEPKCVSLLEVYTMKHVFDLACLWMLALNFLIF